MKSVNYPHPQSSLKIYIPGTTVCLVGDSEYSCTMVSASKKVHISIWEVIYVRNTAPLKITTLKVYIIIYFVKVIIIICQIGYPYTKEVPYLCGMISRASPKPKEITPAIYGLKFLIPLKEISLERILFETCVIYTCVCV